MRTRSKILAVLAVAALLLTAGRMAFAATTLFSDDFEDANTNGWSKSGGTWSVVTDGSRVLRQSSTGGDARAYAGSSGWTNYAVQARVKPLAFTGDGLVAVAARQQSSTNAYRLALYATGIARLETVRSGTVTSIATGSHGLTAGAWATVRVEAQGTTLRGYLNGVLVAQGTGSVYATGKVGLATARATAVFDDVRATSLDPDPQPTGTNEPTPTPTLTAPPPPPPTGLVGFAAMAGNGLSTTTGGAGGTVVRVTTAARFEAEANRRDTLIIEVSGVIDLGDTVYVRSNKTIVGVGANSGFTGGGIKMSGQQNVIVRNLKFSFPTGTDAITIQNSHHVWIDHNELWSDRAHDIDYYDGLIDITHASDFITVSWNVIHDHWKTSLIGHDDDNASEDTGHLTVTYHHNHWYNLDARLPSIRFGRAHIYNNYYSNAVNGVHSRMGAQVLVENNVFRNVTTPIKTTTLSVEDGYAVERGNDFGGGVNTITQVGTWTTPPYGYTLEPTANVVASVLAGAGTGRI